MKNVKSTLSALLLPALLLFLLTACASEAVSQSAEPVQSQLEGRLTVDPEIDDTPNYEGIGVLVIRQHEAGIDTLGHAVTDRDGHFQMEITAPQRDVYPLVIQRYGEVIGMAELVVADGETATFEAELPGLRGLSRIRSDENSAWLAYRNAMEIQNQRFSEILADTLDVNEQLGANMQQTASVLWSLQDSFPGTLGAQMAKAEAVVLLSGWDDEQAVERAREIEPDNPRYVEVGRMARRAQARLEGQEAALALLREFQAQGSEAQRAALQAEIVVAHMDSLNREDALAAARELTQDYGHIEGWNDWAESVTYEVENLMPGMPAPEFTVTTLDGEEVQLEDLRGQVVLLEFYHPRDQLFERQLPARNALYDASEDRPFVLLSVSLESDPLLNEAFLEGRDVPGRHAYIPDGPDSELIDRYNVTTVPTRILIDADGNIVRKYLGGTLPALQEDTARLLAEMTS